MWLCKMPSIQDHFHWNKYSYSYLFDILFHVVVDVMLILNWLRESATIFSLSFQAKWKEACHRISVYRRRTGNRCSIGKRPVDGSTECGTDRRPEISQTSRININLI